MSSKEIIFEDLKISSKNIHIPHILLIFVTVLGHFFFTPFFVELHILNY